MYRLSKIALIIVISACCNISAYATITSGKCGPFLQWQFNDIYNKLSIQGRGEMYNYNDYSNRPPWYKYRDEIKEIYVDEGVRSIGDYAFANFSELKEFSALHFSIKKINAYAFKGCTKLEEIRIPNSLEILNAYAFEECPNVSRITWRATNCEIESGNEKSPFEACASNVRSIEFTTNVQVIPAYLCKGMTNLKEVSIPSSVKQIKKDAFLECLSLNKVFINTLKDWSKIEFESCYSNPTACSHSLHYDRDIEVLEVSIPLDITEIKPYAFYGCWNIHAVSIPNTITSIGEQAFFLCRNVESINIPEGVQSIGTNAFYDVPNVKCDFITFGTAFGARCCNGYVENGIVYEDETKKCVAACVTSKSGDILLPNSVVRINSRAFFNCFDITSIVIPDNVASIEEDAFAYCYDLNKITFPKGLTSIKKKAFKNCKRLQSISIPKNVALIDSTAFDHCDGIKEIEWNVTDYRGTQIPFAKIKTNIQSITFGNNVASIPDFLCAGMPITSIDIPNSVTHIGQSAFEKCSKLISISIPDNCTSIGQDAFRADSLLEHIKLPHQISQIDTGTFMNCKSLHSIDLPQSIREIKFFAFAGSGLTSITIPESTTAIGDCAFYYCKNLTSMVIPIGLTKIGANCFQKCENLNSVIWNAKRCDTESNSKYLSPPFYGCNNITSFVIGESVEVIPNGLCCGLMNIDKIHLPNSVTEIRANAFRDCTSLTEIRLPDNITIVENELFYKDSALKSVIIPENVTHIGEHAFEDCVSLTNILLPANVDTIAGKAFYSCKSVKSMALPDNIQLIDSSAFEKCVSLQSITIPKSVHKLTIVDNAFDGCSALKEIVAPERLSLPASLTKDRNVIRIPVELPDLQIVENSLYLSDVNGNNTIEVDEPCYIRFKLCNNGKGDGKGCTVNLTGQQDYTFIHLVSDTVIGDIASLDTINVSIPIGTTNNARTETVPITIAVKDLQDIETKASSMTLHTSRFAKPSVSVKSSELFSYGNTATKAMPITIRMNIQNPSLGFAKDVKCEIQLPNGCVKSKGELSYQWETLYPGANQNITFDFIPTESVQNAIEIPYTLSEKYGMYAESGTIPIIFGETPTFRITSSEDKALAIAGTPRINIITNTSVSILRPEWYNKYHNPQNIKDPFPYAVIQLELKGDKEAVDLAKERLSLVMGGKHIVEAKDSKESNMIYFLVHCRKEYIDLDCGDGCKPINIWKERLEPNKVYHGSVSVGVQ